MKTLTHTELIKEINKNFVIRIKYDDQDRTQLVGAGRYQEHAGEIYTEKHFLKALSQGEQRYEFRVRGKLTANFIAR